MDIVAQTEEELVIVEVKAREENSLLLPEEAVGRVKINRIRSSGGLYENFCIDLPLHFDVVIVIGKILNCWIEHIPEVFYHSMNTYL